MKSEPATRAPSGWVLLPFALGGGLVGSLAFAPFSWWPAAFVAVGVLAVVIGAAPRLRAALGLGLAYGLAFNLVTIRWQILIEVGSYLGLALLQALFFALLGGLLWLVRRLRWAPLAAACCWVLVEALQARVPFGGFSWTRLGYAVVDTPLSGLYPLAGAALATFAVALVAHTAVWALSGRRRREFLMAAGVAVSVLALGALGTLVPTTPTNRPSIDVGWVQGGSGGGGFYGLGEPGETTRRHAAQTRVLLGDADAGRVAKPAFIVWPENGTDNDPLLDPTTNKIVADVVADAGVPLLLGVPTNGPGPGERQTTDLWWTNAGIGARYDKRNLVPFGEWIPFRDVLLPLIPTLQVIGDQAIPGTLPGVLSVQDASGNPLKVGVAICYEVSFADTMADAVTHGAEVMVVGSNNAMFQGSPQIEQQFAITRVRAAELRRQILVVTVSGLTGLIGERGEITMRAPLQDAASGVVSLVRSDSRTPYVLGGWVFEWVAVALALAAAVAGAVAGRVRAGDRMAARSEPQEGDSTHG
ncbi:MAG TPA: apolipoprotein N-acyltransferase [Propioniciclava tarda]|nr:apolipoprotein N-acyltransferase [Propioniciclava tarda]